MVVEVDATEGFLSMDRSCEFVTIPRDLDVKERQRTVFFFFDGEFDVSMT